MSVTGHNRLETPRHGGLYSASKLRRGEPPKWRSPTTGEGSSLVTPLKAKHYSPATPWTESTMMDDRSWIESVDTPVPTERVSLLTITPVERFHPVPHDAATVASDEDDYHSLVNSLRQQCIGEEEHVPCPLDGSHRRLIYCDYTASGRALRSLEDFISNQVCPMYANTHSVASATARQTAHFREEARDRVKQYFNCSEDDSAIFCGAGATGAIRKFEDMLIKSRVFAPAKEREETLQSVTGSHVELAKTRTSPEAIEVELVVLPLDSTKGIASVEGLREVLEQISIFNRHHGADYAIPVVILSACSNVTGACQDMPSVSTLVHTFRGIIAWDCAAIAAHRKVDMNPATHPEGYIDFAFISPHKLLGGPGTSGILLCKKKRQTNSIPTICGGGTVEFVSSRGHYYISDLEEREEAGEKIPSVCQRPSSEGRSAIKYPYSVPWLVDECIRLISS
ncbi:hypothetical protein FOZ60_014518 [Perkinsus olseni]|uniref:Aminotransferase class V domain-containing protein n=2 Tax=Perkinsus olseni TaxID=32597 RepID=A0A7J6P6Y9_PEROL|nr:hypothetical protein FOZ60_014518 [Perkinsus olseni]